jgi:hypothetical protein
MSSGGNTHSIQEGGSSPGEPVDEVPESVESASSNAVLWRTTLQVAIRFRDTPPALAEELWLGLRGRLWSRLTKPDGSRYKQFHEFCEAPQPHGLGTAHVLVNRLLVEIGNAREVRLLTVDPGCQGRRDGPAPTSRHNGGMSSTRTTERLRAIAERCPTPIQRLYTAGLIDQIDAEPFGRKQPSPEREAQIADFVGRVAAPLAMKIEGGWAPSDDERRDLRRGVKSDIRLVFAVMPPSSPAAAAGNDAIDEGFPATPATAATPATQPGRAHARPYGVALAGPRTIELCPPTELVEMPAETTLLGYAPVAARTAAALPLSAEQAAQMTLPDLIRCYWLVVRDLFESRLAPLREERWIHYELHPTVLCERATKGERGLQQTIERVELALETAARREAVALRRARKPVVVTAPLARTSASRAPAKAKRAAARSS